MVRLCDQTEKVFFVFFCFFVCLFVCLLLVFARAERFCMDIHDSASLILDCYTILCAHFAAEEFTRFVHDHPEYLKLFLLFQDTRDQQQGMQQPEKSSTA